MSHNARLKANGGESEASRRPDGYRIGRDDEISLFKWFSRFILPNGVTQHPSFDSHPYFVVRYHFSQGKRPKAGKVRLRGAPTANKTDKAIRYCYKNDFRASFYQTDSHNALLLTHTPFSWYDTTFTTVKGLRRGKRSFEAPRRSRNWTRRWVIASKINLRRFFQFNPTEVFSI
jgi:hypothetical protein